MKLTNKKAWTRNITVHEVDKSGSKYNNKRGT